MRPLHALLPTVLTLVVVAPATADSPTRLFGHPKGDLSAKVDMRTTSGCVERDTHIEPVRHSDGTEEVFARVTEYDRCAGSVVFEHNGATNVLTMAIADDLSSASVQATVPMFEGPIEESPPTDPLDVDLAWQATGPVADTTTLYEDGHRGDITLVNHDREGCRDAAVTGTPADPVVGASLCQQLPGSLFLYIEK